ncbi:hypothetical protein [Phenylobacterium deserti]|uniref:Uncharacterized protein n=1 Tax=Phenylobacterium deserti TaxID=1914756 RepID=A0A328AT35_9CAUL|nr:hypothetical protein [Phenylobacterium deserti]RAK57767.1 hypothetical protein DJ018_07555 [Phenylobacterium deserti]
MAGVSVGAVAFGVSYGVLRFYSYELADFPIFVAAIVLLSMVAGFVAYKRAARRHRRAVTSELATEASEADRSHDEQG